MKRLVDNMGVCIEAEKIHSHITSAQWHNFEKSSLDRNLFDLRSTPTAPFTSSIPYLILTGRHTDF